MSRGHGGVRLRLRALTPGVAVDIEGVTVLRESIDERYDASGAGEDGAPVLESEIGRDDRAGAFVATANDAVEEVSGASIAGEISKFVEEQKRRRRVALHASLDRRKRLLLEEIGERGVHGREAH